MRIRKNCLKQIGFRHVERLFIQRAYIVKVLCPYNGLNSTTSRVFDVMLRSICDIFRMISLLAFYRFSIVFTMKCGGRYRT